MTTGDCFAALEPEPEPATPVESRAAVGAMPPRVDLQDAAWGFLLDRRRQGAHLHHRREACLADLKVTVAALPVGRSPAATGA